MRNAHDEDIILDNFYMDSNADVYFIFDNKGEFVAENLFGGDYLLDSSKRELTLEQGQRGIVGILDPSKLRLVDSDEFSHYLGTLRRIADEYAQDHSERTEEPTRETIKILYTPESYVKAGHQIMTEGIYAQSQPSCTEERLFRSRSKLVADLVTEQHKTGKQNLC